MSRWELILLKPEMEENIKDPTWDQIKKYLDKVDGDNLDNLALSNPSIGEMLICGGNEIEGKRVYGVSLFPF